MMSCVFGSFNLFGIHVIMLEKSYLFLLVSHQGYESSAL